jgi:hypothetical protein
LGGVDVRDTPGDHFSMLQQPNVGLLASAVNTDVAAARASEIPNDTNYVCRSPTCHLAEAQGVAYRSH